MPAHALIAARAEGLFARASEQNHADCLIVAGPRKGIQQLANRLGAKGVTLLGPVDRDFGDTLASGIVLVDDVGVCMDVFPLDWHICSSEGIPPAAAWYFSIFG